MAKTGDVLEALLLLLATVFIAGVVYVMATAGGCTSYSVEDFVRESTRKATTQPVHTVEVGRKSHSSGIWKDVAPPQHGESNIGTTTLGKSDWGEIATSNTVTILIVIGGIAVLAGVAGAVAFKLYWLGGGVAVAGLVLIGVGWYPWLLLGLPVLALIGAVYFLYGSAQGTKLRKAFAQTVDGVQVAKKSMIPVAKQEAFNEKLMAVQDETTKKLVGKVKGKV